MNTNGKSYAGYAGRLEGFVNTLPQAAVFSPAFDSLSTEERLKFSRALEEYINKELPRLQTLKPE